MLSVDESGNIKLTRGDTGIFKIDLVDGSGEPYTPEQGSSLTFSMAKTAGSEVVLTKQIPIDTMELELEPADSKDFGFETFAYDIQLTDEVGRVFTVLLGKIAFTKEIG